MDQKILGLISKVKSAVSELEAACAGKGMGEEQEESALEMDGESEASAPAKPDMSEKKNLVKMMLKKKGF